MIALEQRHALGVLIRSARWARRQAVCQSASRQSASPAKCRRAIPRTLRLAATFSMQNLPRSPNCSPVRVRNSKSEHFSKFFEGRDRISENLPRSPNCSPVRVRNSESKHFSKVFEGRDRISKISIDLPTHKSEHFSVTSVTKFPLRPLHKLNACGRSRSPKQ